VTLLYRPDVVYCYREVIAPPFVARTLTGATVVYDIRADPYAQAKEFSERGVIGSTIHEASLELGRVTHGIALPRADAVITLSEPLERTLHEEYGVARSALAIVPLGVDTERFTPAETTGDPVRLVYMGAIIPVRGLETVIEALATLDPGVRDRVRLDLYGDADPEYVATLGDLAARRGVDDLFHWHGYVDHEDVPEAVGTCDVALSPLPPLEAFAVSSPAKVYEYLALGLPVVATRIPPHERILTDGEDSILVDPDDADRLGTAIRRLVTDPERRERLGARAREHALRHDWESRFEDVLEVVETAGEGSERPVGVLSESGQPGGP
jgi:glycosyltransferase involved in cell wall biosynthesis